MTADKGGGRMEPKTQRLCGAAFWRAAGQMAALWAVAAALAAQILPGAELALPEEPCALAARALWLCVALPLGEELIFRGGMQRLLERFGPSAALAGQAILFAAAHGGGAQKLYALAMGLIFGWGVQRTGRVWPGAVLHSLNNWIVFAGCLAGRNA